jgi:hypothetical protein
MCPGRVWFVDGAPAYWYESVYRHTAGSTAFNLRVTVQNSRGLQVHGFRDVAVGENGSDCLDQ